MSHPPDPSFLFDSLPAPGTTKPRLDIGLSANAGVRFRSPPRPQLRAAGGGGVTAAAAVLRGLDGALAGGDV